MNVPVLARGEAGTFATVMITAVLGLLAAALFTSQAALAADAPFEGEDMAHGAFADEPADPGAQNGVALRYEDQGSATYNVNLTSAADTVLVRSRSAPASTGSVTVSVVVDGKAQTAKTIGSSGIGKTYALYSWPVNLSPGSHKIEVRGGDLRGTDKLLVDNVRLTTSDAKPDTPAYQCDVYASPTGSDTMGTGTLANPWKTAKKLITSTPPGQRGCLRGGRYQTITYPAAGDSPTDVARQTATITVPGGTSDSARRTFSNYPGEKAEICAFINIPGSTRWVTFEGDVLGNFVLDGTCGPDSGLTNQGRHNTRTSPRVWGDNITFNKVEVHKKIAETQPDYLTGVCFHIGSDANVAENILIEHTAVHHCGTTEPSGVQPADDAASMPGGGPDNHCVYADNPGTGSVLEKSLIYYCGEQGIQLYDDADDMVVQSNIFYGSLRNVIINGTSSRNMVRNNIAASPRKAGENINTGGAATGTENQVQDNCGWQAGGTSGIGSGGSVYSSFTGNIAANPLLTNPATLSMAVSANSSCSTKYFGP